MSICERLTEHHLRNSDFSLALDGLSTKYGEQHRKQREALILDFSFRLTLTRDDAHHLRRRTQHHLRRRTQTLLP